MPGKDKMEIEIAFKALAFFAAFMAARSLTAYFKKSNSAAKRGTIVPRHGALLICYAPDQNCVTSFATPCIVHRVAGKRSLYHHHNKRSLDHHSREHNRNWNCSCKRAPQLFLLQRRQGPPPLRDKFHGWHKFRDKLHGGQRLRDTLLLERDALLHERLHGQKHRSM